MGEVFATLGEGEGKGKRRKGRTINLGKGEGKRRSSIGGHYLFRLDRLDERPHGRREGNGTGNS